MSMYLDLAIQEATLGDVPDISELLKMYSEADILLPRSNTDIYHSLRNFRIIRDNGRLAACASLMIYNHELAEIRSLAVHPDYQEQGLGKRLVQQLEKESIELGLARLMALTYVVGFFQDLEFTVVDMAKLPEKVWNACVHCRKFNNCDETAMVKYL
ncbi:MAG: N-acetyltransferase [Gammaproteobacteria bacterium]|nr:N-acetyltransferase [Gammaproteobacteria bacterium]MCY4228688.1 N-acetyltransferase [Gammaproteobacteria bacterium]